MKIDAFFRECPRCHKWPMSFVDIDRYSSYGKPTLRLRCGNCQSMITDPLGAGAPKEPRGMARSGTPSDERKF